MTQWTVKRAMVVVGVCSTACNKESRPPPVPWEDQPLKVIKSTVVRRGSAPVAWSISAPEEMVEAREVAKEKFSSEELRFFHAPEHPGLSFSIFEYRADPGDDPEAAWRKNVGSDTHATGSDGFEHVGWLPDLHQLQVNVLRVKNGVALSCTASYISPSTTDHQKAALHAICESVKIE